MLSGYCRPQSASGCVVSRFAPGRAVAHVYRTVDGTRPPVRPSVHGGNDAEPPWIRPAGSFERGKGEQTPPAGSSRDLRCAAEGGGRGVAERGERR